MIRALVLATRVGLLVLLAPGPADAAAQEASPEDGEEPAPYVDPARSVAWLARRIARHPDEIRLRLAAARELTTLGVLDSARAARLSWLKRAEAEAGAAIALDSTDADAHYWLAASLGLAADENGGLAKISAARGAHAAVLAALARDPNHPGAHHILGRLHAGALRLSRLNRLIARGLGLGAVLSSASWESAEAHLRVAATGDPDRWVHTLELAKLLARRKRDDEAAVLLRDLAGRSPRHDLDRRCRDEAVKLLGAGGGGPY
jgi:hypothetical protein